MRAGHNSLHLIAMCFAFSSAFTALYHLELLSGALDVSTTFWNSELATGSQNSFISSFICIEKTQDGAGGKMSTSYPLSKTEISKSRLFDPGKFPSDLWNSTYQNWNPPSSPFLSILLYHVFYLVRYNQHSPGCPRPGSHSSQMLPPFLIPAVIQFLLILHPRYPWTYIRFSSCTATAPF